MRESVRILCKAAFPMHTGRPLPGSRAQDGSAQDKGQHQGSVCLLLPAEQGPLNGRE